MSPPYVELRPTIAAEISLVWGTPANFNGFPVLTALLHWSLVVGVSQTLPRWTESATYIWQGGHDVGHWPTFLVLSISPVKQAASFTAVIPIMVTFATTITGPVLLVTGANLCINFVQHLFSKYAWQQNSGLATQVTGLLTTLTSLHTTLPYAPEF